MTDEDQLKTVKITYSGSNQKNNETWLCLLEQFLLCGFKDYTITVTQDSYERSTHVVINFASVEDATLFKLQRS